eukprot:TRINITY_DN553_c2_g1_i1.p1 TRINITY_DN553_c2_g1~~TRINITY_DN553_c2_g1_i1.p1  ORF type:complete len:128 (+),score=34.67 TRINITY_DN553_c2_g1_i1:153-536(+)
MSNIPEGLGSGEGFQELERQMVDYQRKLNQVVQKLQIVEREKKKAEITRQEVTKLPEDTKSFVVIGNAYLVNPIKDTSSELEARVNFCERETQSLRDQQLHLEKRMTECQVQLREIVNAYLKSQAKK